MREWNSSIIRGSLHGAEVGIVLRRVWVRGDGGRVWRQRKCLFVDIQGQIERLHLPHR